MEASSLSSPLKINPNVSSWCETDVKEIKFGHIWTIKKFSKVQIETAVGESIESSIFSAPADDKSKWQLDLHPTGDTEEHKNFVAPFLNHVPDHKSLEVTATFELSILNNKREKSYIKKTATRSFKHGHRSWGYNQYIKRDDLMDASKGLLLNDTLTICCEVVIFSMPENAKLLCDPICVKDARDRLTTDLERLLENKDSSDVVLVAEGKELHAHTTILSARSPVFAAIFKHDTEEKQQKVVIPDITHNVLQELIRFIYTGNAPALDEKTAMELLAAADKYALKDLKFICEQALCITIRHEIVYDLVILASKHNANYLTGRIIQYLKSNATDDDVNQIWSNVISKHPELVANVFQNFKFD